MTPLDANSDCSWTWSDVAASIFPKKPFSRNANDKQKDKGDRGVNSASQTSLGDLIRILKRPQRFSMFEELNAFIVIRKDMRYSMEGCMQIIQELINPFGESNVNQ